MATLDEQIERLKNKKADTEAELNKLLNIKGDPAKALATDLHEMFCTANHTDGCGWYYNEDWNTYTRADYLKKAKKLLLNYNRSEVMDIAKTIKG